MIDLMEWSKSIVDALMNKNNIRKGRPYRVKITCDPNPLNFDGMNKVVIEVIKIHDFSPVDSVLYSTDVEYCFNIEDAVEKVNHWLIKELKI